MTMKIVMISDTHNKHNKLVIPDGDMIIHAGDATGLGRSDELRKFINWFGSLPHKHKIIIAGNHDWGLEGDQNNWDRFHSRRGGMFTIDDMPANKAMALHMFKQYGIHYLENKSITIDCIKIYGSPYQPEFGGWAFNKYRGPDIKKEWDQIPDDVNILVTHGPPYQILDEVDHGDFVGCEELHNRIKRLSDLKLHVFGHIHEGRGMKMHNGVTYINASALDENYLPYKEACFVLEYEDL